MAITKLLPDGICLTSRRNILLKKVEKIENKTMPQVIKPPKGSIFILLLRMGVAHSVGQCLKIRNSQNDFLNLTFPPKKEWTNSTLLIWNLKLTWAESAWDNPFLNRKIFLFHYQIFILHFFVINFSYLVIRFLLNSSMVKSNNEIGKVNDKKILI